MNTPDTLIIGAGVSGLSCAHHLMAEGLDCLILEKARGPGGRISSKRVDDSAVDLGAQYFTARDPAFVEQVEAWLAAGVVQHWTPRIAVIDGDGWTDSPDQQARFVGAPKMGALAHHMAQSQEIWAQTRISSVMDHHVALEDGRVLDFEHLVMASPADQTAQLHPDLQVPQQAPCWAMWVDIDGEQPFDAGFVKDSIIGWIALDSSKPGRSTQNRWVIHPTPEFSQQQLESEPDTVAEQLIQALRLVLPREFKVLKQGLHRWRYARPWSQDEGVREGILTPTDEITVCGDYLLGGRVEGAWLSGRLAAQRIIDQRS